MGFNLQTGYSLPGADKPLTHARILHAGNRLPIKTVTASTEASATTPAIAVDSALTSERWKPFANLLQSPLDLTDADVWTPSRFIPLDANTLDEGADVATTRTIQQDFTFEADQYVYAVKISRETMTGLRIEANDGTTTYSGAVDLRNGTLVQPDGDVDDTRLVDLGDGDFELIIVFTPAAAAGYVRITGLEANGVDLTYTGLNRTVRINRVVLHKSVATLRLDAFDNLSAEMFAVAGHNLGSAGARIAFEHDDNEDGTFTTLDTSEPEDDSPIMYLFGAVTSERWRITVDLGVLPEIAVVRIGNALQMERAIHQNQQPLKNNRQTAVRGNLSEAGSWIGRSTIRTALQGQFEWKHLTPSFIAANIDGRDGIIQAMEREPAFIAWRPATYAEANYIWTTGPLSGPVFNQSPNLSSFSLPVQALGFE